MSVNNNFLFQAGIPAAQVLQGNTVSGRRSLARSCACASHGSAALPLAGGAIVSRLRMRSRRAPSASAPFDKIYSIHLVGLKGFKDSYLCLLLFSADDAFKFRLHFLHD